MRRIRPLLLVSLVGLLLPLLVAAAPTATAVRGADGPNVHPEVRASLASPDSVLEVVVTTWDAPGLRALDEAGVAHRKLRTMPIALARMSGAQLDQLAEDTRVRSVWPVESYDLLVEEGTAIVGADRVAADYGVDGEGVIVGVIDTGLDTTHPDLDGDKVLGNFQVVGDLEGPVLVPSPFTDDNGHGTHVASTIAGRDEAVDDDNGDMSGVAPGAQLYGYAINAGTSVLSSLAIVAFDDLIQRRLLGEPIVAASNSWGGSDGTYTPDDPLAVATRALFDAGIVPVFAAGNSGPGLQTASNQCTIPWTFCVGAITKGRTLAGFSSRGRTPTPTTEYEPTEDRSDEDAGTPIAAGNHDVALGQALEVGVYRPNVSAPGVDIEAACSAAAGCPGGYQSMSGTSMATPHVSGVIALAQSARLAAGGDLLSAEAVTSLVENTANRMPGYELWEVGTGEVDALEAVALVLAAGDGDVAIPTANYGATTAEGGEPTSESYTGEVLTNGWGTGVGTYVEAFEVGEGIGKLHALLTWPNRTDNIYLNLYAPGLVPGEDSPTAQSAGLLDGTGPYMRGYRELDVHFPDPGTWRLEVLGRNNVPTEVTVDITQFPVERPEVLIDDVTGEQVAGTTDAGALAAPSRTGVTRDGVPGTAEPLAATGEPTSFWLHSTTAGPVDGAANLIFVDPPLASTFDQEAPTTPVSTVSEMTPLANSAYAANFLTAYWRGQIDGAVAGDLPVELFMSSPTGAAFTSNMTATLFAVPPGYQGVDEAEVLATTAADAVLGATPTSVELTFRDVLTGDLTGRDVVLQVTATYIDTGHVQIWHDSTTHPSGMVVPVLDPASAPLLAPQGLQATDMVGGGAIVTWEAVDGANSYVVEATSSLEDGFTSLGTVEGTEFVHGDAPVRETTYYRVRSVGSNGTSSASEIVYATPIDDTPFVEVQFGLGPWELATLDGGNWTYQRVLSSESCEDGGEVFPGKGRGAEKGKGAANRFGGDCDGDTVVLAPLPEGDVQARGSRWFTTSAVATQAR